MCIRNSRLERERITIRVMIEIYCRGNHDSKENLCADCQQLYDYAMQRIDRCPYQDDKPTCAKCPIHCYRPDMREKVRRVMRYAGPRMIFSHPILTILHYVDEITRRNTVNIV
ncbi:MAG: nitrous oxide-stimulated promoter family protein [Anaerolineales bacterium]|nr:nitrous oxide-stimulated promoter family protein [Anaerolineales bacterium]